jgi:hypothetical protein
MSKDVVLYHEMDCISADAHAYKMRHPTRESCALRVTRVLRHFTTCVLGFNTFAHHHYYNITNRTLALQVAPGNGCAANPE